TVTKGAFNGSGVTFQAPEAFTLYEIYRTDDVDRVILHGPKDTSRYKPDIYVFLHREPLDLERADADAEADVAYIKDGLKGYNAILVAEEPTFVNGAPATRRVFFFHETRDFVRLLIRWHFNADGAGVTLDYCARAATRSILEDTSALRALAESVRIE
ncbi:MAG TPA: hypothetical protein VLA21_06045, partial [Candidatus Limnocylindria bacterium]|nr:hypothetical protein [Candidatus Limnocylindria bacterium]